MAVVEEAGEGPVDDDLEVYSATSPLGTAINGKLYASQGLLPGFKPAGLVYEYDPAGDAWTQKKPMPHPVHHAAVTAFNGKMYLFGGFDLPGSGPPGWLGERPWQTTGIRNGYRAAWR